MYQKLLVLIAISSTVLLTACTNTCNITGHDFTPATCISPQVCTKCGEVVGEALGHQWVHATCTEPKTCSVCGESNGDKLSASGQHTWNDATCTEPKTCSVCGEVSGEVLGHQYNSKGICEICNETKEFQNSTGYYSKSDLYTMAKDAIENHLYPDYVQNYAPSYDIFVEKADTTLYGDDCFTILFSVDVTHNSSTSEKIYAVVVEPLSFTSYLTIDIFSY